MVAFALIGLAMAVLIVGNVVSGAVVASYHADRRAEVRRADSRPGRGRVPEPGGLARAGRVPGRGGGGQRARDPGAARLGRRLRRGQPAGAAGGPRSSPRPGCSPWCCWPGSARRCARAGCPPRRRSRPAAPRGRDAGTPPTGSPPGCACRGRSGLGLAAPFARPARTAVTLAAIAFGATAVIFAFGLNSSLSRAAASQTHSATIPVRVEQFGPGRGPGQMPTAAQDAAVAAALRAQPGTLHEVALYGNGVKVPGIAGTVNAPCVRRRRRLDRVRDHRRPLVRRARRGGRQHRVPGPERSRRR